jgi:serine/threonine-protein kinase
MHTVYLNAFYIDQYEVTVKEYARFLNENGGDAHYHEYMGRSSDCGIIRKGENRFIVSPGRENYPIIYVNGEDAAAYAAWVGKRLPTEAEWERAARGIEGRIYPWGNEEPDSTRANFYFMHGGSVPVGSYPKGITPEKVYDMAGNVWEWCADEPAPYPKGRVENPFNQSKFRGVIRGGCWATPKINLKSPVRESEYRSRRNAFTGFRCVKDTE